MSGRVEGGVDALSTKPISEVFIPQEDAIKLLSPRTRLVYNSNVDTLAKLVSSNSPDYDAAVNAVLSLKNDFDRFAGKGGLATTPEELAGMYDLWARLTYDQVMTKFMRDIFPPFLETTHRVPANIITGYLLDTSRIIDPKVAGFIDSVDVMARVIRRGTTPFTPFHFGIIVDDTIKMKGGTQIPIDLLADSNGATQLKDAYLEVASPNEREQFMSGLTISLNELQLRNLGFSTN